MNDTCADPGAADDTSGVAWQRLDVRLVWVNGVKFLLSSTTGVIGFFLFDAGPIWPLLVVGAWGVLSTVRDFLRWTFTRYRVTDDRVERRTGWLVREYRFVQRDRIRSVSSSAKLRHRIVALRVLHIGSGHAGHLRSAFTLDALDLGMAERLRRELLPEQWVDPREGETVIARLRWYWVFYNVFHVWALLAGILFLISAYTSMLTFGVDLYGVVERLYERLHPSFWWALGTAVGATSLLGFFSLALDFAAKHWHYELVRTPDTEGGGSALLTRQGLFTTRTVHRQDRRIRGIHLSEPLVWRWMRLAETRVVTTGLTAALSESAAILPRAPVGDALQVARSVCGADLRPLEAPLTGHPPGALRRRLLWATYLPATAAALLWWLGETDVLDPTAWRIPLFLLPLTWWLAVLAYRALGHAFVGPYLVVRKGAANRSTTVLQCDAVIGWRMHQTILQRFGSRLSVGIPTAAGDRYYHLLDASVDQALAFMAHATPALAEQFLAPAGRAAPRLPRAAPRIAANLPIDLSRESSDPHPMSGSNDEPSEESGRSRDEPDRSRVQFDVLRLRTRPDHT